MGGGGKCSQLSTFTCNINCVQFHDEVAVHRARLGKKGMSWHEVLLSGGFTMPYITSSSDYRFILYNIGFLDMQNVYQQIGKLCLVVFLLNQFQYCWGLANVYIISNIECRHTPIMGHSIVE